MNYEFIRTLQTNMTGGLTDLVIKANIQVPSPGVKLVTF